MNFSTLTKRLLFNDVLIALVMLGLIWTNYDARGLARGTPGFIDRSRAGALDFLAAWFFFSAATLIYHALRGRPVTRWPFAFLTLPFLLYITATAVYTAVTPDTAKSGVVIYGGFYALLLKRAWTRPKDGHDE